MSALGHFRPIPARHLMSTLSPIATEERTSIDVGFVPKATKRAYSITSLARARSADGNLDAEVVAGSSRRGRTLQTGFPKRLPKSNCGHDGRQHQCCDHHLDYHKTRHLLA